MVDDVILWYRDLTSDKLWGVVSYQERAIRFWGRRGRELSFKLLTASEQNKMLTVENRKRREGYRDTSFDELEQELPGFKAEFDQMLILAVLGDNYRHTRGSTIAGL